MKLRSFYFKTTICAWLTAVSFTLCFHCAYCNAPDEWLRDKVITRMLEQYVVLPLSAYLNGALHNFEVANRWIEASGFGFQSLIILSNSKEAMIIHELSTWNKDANAMITSRRIYQISLDQMKSISGYLDLMPSADSASEQLSSGDDFGFVSSETFDGTSFSSATYVKADVVKQYRDTVKVILKTIDAKK